MGKPSTQAYPRALEPDRSGNLPAEPALGAADPGIVRTVAIAWWLGMKPTHGRPLGPETAEHQMWQPTRLEYSLSLASPGPGAETVLSAAEYASGSLDWHQFDIVGSLRRAALFQASRFL